MIGFDCGLFRCWVAGLFVYWFTGECFLDSGLVVGWLFWIVVFAWVWWICLRLLVLRDICGLWFVAWVLYLGWIVCGLGLFCVMLVVFWTLIARLRQWVVVLGFGFDVLLGCLIVGGYFVGCGLVC